MELIITNHATHRARERFNWKRESLRRMAIRSMQSGIDITNARGRIKQFIQNEIEKFGRANNTKIYGEQIFLFRDNVLLTVLHLPNELKPIIRKIKREN